MKPLRAVVCGVGGRMGGRILSAPEDRVLRVAACDGAARVEVVVAPSGSSSATCTPPPANAAARTLRVTASPHSVRIRRRSTVKVLVRSGAQRVGGAQVRLAGATARTDRLGRATD